MRKYLTKIICVIVAAVAAAAIALVAACGATYSVTALKGDYSGAVTSNGGFAVKKGDYIYFVNGKQSNTADNTFGSVVKGSIMRISAADFSARNYGSAETVVPQIVYSGNYNSGIYIYGDYVYYATPSTEKNSDGEIQSAHLAFKRTRLDATGTMKDYYIQFSDSSVDYRYVEADGTVYLLYAAKDENLYGTSCTNLHSLNLSNNVNTLLAYNIDGYVFDASDLTGGRVYYTMKVKDLATNSVNDNYNQIYTVTADKTTPNEYDFSAVENYDAGKDPVYVNCGDLVFDGIGKIDHITESVTQFNGVTEAEAEVITHSPYTYGLSRYDGENGMLYYTRISKVVEDEGSKALFGVKESALLSSAHHPVTDNPENSACLISDAAEADNYTYLYKGEELDSVLISGDGGFTKARVVGGKITSEKDDNVGYANRFLIRCGGLPTPLFIEEHGGSSYIYYSVSGGSGYSFNRVCIDGTNADYNDYPLVDGVDEYTPVRILDLEAVSSWYKPEMIDGQLLFATETEADVLNDYNYIMACDLRVDGGAVRTNAQLKELNDKFEGIAEQIEEIDGEVYENLQSALTYAYITGDGNYLGRLIKAYKDVLGYDEEKFWSAQSVEKYHAFIDAAADGEWGEHSQTVKVDGNDVAANKRDYYYSFTGKIADADKDEYSDALKSRYLQPYPEKETEEWYEPLGVNSALKGGFAVAGIVIAGLAVIAAAVVVPLVIVGKRRKSGSVYRRRYKVDTTDDRNIDVYADENKPADDGENG